MVNEKNYQFDTQGTILGIKMNFLNYYLENGKGFENNYILFVKENYLIGLTASEVCGNNETGILRVRYR